MNWIIFILVSYLCLALQNGLQPLLSIGGATPSLVLVLAVYVGLHAPSLLVAWVWLALGVCVDLTTTTVQDYTILGPAALGYLAGAFAVVQLRTFVFRESVVTLAALVLLCGIFVELVTVAVFTLRGVSFITGEPVPGWDVSNQLVHRFLVLLYSAAASVVMGPILFRLGPLLGFSSKTSRS